VESGLEMGLEPLHLQAVEPIVLDELDSALDEFRATGWIVQK
jgi:hypothetical protein